MVRWRSASAVFLGGTKEALTLKVRMVKNRVPRLSSPLYDPINFASEIRDVHATSVGLLANAICNELLLPSPKTPGVVPTSLEAMQRLN